MRLRQDKANENKIAEMQKKETVKVNSRVEQKYMN